MNRHAPASPIPEDALNAHIAILGTTGGGKSYTARGLTERLLSAGRRMCILDPVGVWWGLRSAASGDRPGFPIAVIGGEHGDMPLTETMAAPLAAAVAGNNLPVVIDTSEMGVAERNRFLTGFLADLYRLNRQALWLVLEEADEIAPQSPMPESRRLLDAVDKIARRGRARGFRLLMVSQRPAVLHKNMLSQIRTMIAHRLTAPQDTKAINDWIKGNADLGLADTVVSSLPTLSTGEAWVWHPESGLLNRTAMPRITTFDSSATPDPDDSPIQPVGLAEIDLSAIHAALEADPEASATLPAQPSRKALEEAEKRGYSRGYDAGRAEEEQRWRTRIAELLGNTPAPAQVPAKAAPAKPPIKPVPRPTANSSRPSVSTADGEIPSTARRMLDMLDTNPPIRMSWSQLAASVGIKARGGHFNTIRKWLTESGRILEDGTLIRIAEPSKAAPEPLAPEELASVLRDRWREILGGRPADIITLLENHGPMTRDDIAQMLDCVPRGGHWNTAWKALRDNALIRDAGNGRVSLSAELAT